MSTHFDAVVLGDGPVGRTTADELLSRGQRVRVVTRSGSGPRSADRHRADVTDAAAVATAIGDAPLVVMATHAPYRSAAWRDLLPRMERPVLAHVTTTGATLVLPESLYAFDPDAGPISATTPRRPRSPKGEVRRDLLAAREASGARVRSVAAGDFVGPRVLASAAGETLAGRIVAGGRPVAFGRADLPHAFTYVPDLVRAMLAAAELPGDGHRLLMAPHAGSITQQALADVLADAAAVPRRKVLTLGTVTSALVGAVVPDVRELREVIYQFTQPFEIDATADEELLGLTATPWDHAAKETVDWWRSRP